MSLKIDNLNYGVSKKDEVKQNNKNIKSDLSVSSFKNSLDESLSLQGENQLNSKHKIEEKVFDETLYDTLNEDDKQLLQVILSILNVLGSEKIDTQSNFFEFNDNFTIGDLKEVKDIEFDNTKQLYSDSLNKMNVFENVSKPEFNEIEKIQISSFDNESIQNVLIEMGFDLKKINSKDISNGEIIQKVMDNVDGFKNLVRNEFDKIGENNSDVKFLDEINFEGFLLNDKELIRNIENEISIKLNTKLNNEVSVNKTDDSDYKVLHNFKSISDMVRIDDKSNSDEHILKEISGEAQINKNIENYFVNAFRNNTEENVNVKFNKILDTSNHQNIVKEFIENIEYMASNNKNQMVVKLNPDHLGRMDVKYEVVKDNVRLMIRVENKDAFKVMESTITDIRNMIKETHNINLENIQVDLQEFSFNANDGGGNNKRNNENVDFKNLKSPTIEIDNEGNDNDDRNNLRDGILV
ncbi:flagellar hook-length control protein FliK [Candidatus Arthromitus sp. SFB-rat-Yit]|uniref:flagellar hook-length control protein FliK n=1 Tax=Candidatus Arthromitus sp. SFB-rat-Yit TaxID=1041504 RepID=UPI000227A1F5|nr:flagellar hook-length control protein FliK [Candidatus Arthromitus sp. SFB-rat-Yit]BAK81373.1 putative flagellar hook-length control protein [Candidatus Arthromitus sp. SFB-rat-Yit]